MTGTGWDAKSLTRFFLFKQTTISMANVLFVIPHLFEGTKHLWSHEPSIQQVKAEYWDRWRGDEIRNQSIANLVVDWLWQEGRESIRKVQVILGVEPNGIICDQTLNRLNDMNPLVLFRRIRSERIFDTLEEASTDPTLRQGMQKKLRHLESFRFWSD